jgi:GntR family transcriptional regulator/MocR family aminotransferase
VVGQGVDVLLASDPAYGRRAGLERALRDAIRTGRLSAGARLPSTRALATDLGVARGTVVEAYAQLAAEGYLVARQGAATTVAHLPAPVPPAAGRPPSADAPRVDLRSGEPDLGAFPRGAWLSALRGVLQTVPPHVLGYGDPRGRPELRAALAAYLTRARGVVADPDRIVVTSGFSSGFARLARALAAGGVTVVAMEDPGQPLHRRIARDEGLSVTGVPVDRDGMLVSALAALTAGAVVVTPAHQFPLGGTLASVRRTALAAWARDRGAIVVEDDYDGEFRYDRMPVGALQGLDPRRVVYAGTTSKTLAPALRLAWLVVPDPLLEPLVEDRRHRETAPALDQLALTELLTSGRFDRHVRRMRADYRRRRDLLVGALAARAPGCRPGGVAAGLHAMVGLPADGPGEAEVARRAAVAGVAVDLLGPHWLGPPTAEGVLVGYCRPPAHAFRSAVDAVTGLLA